jgi:hypothetical protein
MLLQGPLLLGRSLRDVPLLTRELQASCPGLQQTLAARTKELNDLLVKADAEFNAPPQTLWSAIQRVNGKLDARTEALIANQRTMIYELRAELEAKNCSTAHVDVVEQDTHL